MCCINATSRTQVFRGYFALSRPRSEGLDPPSPLFGGAICAYAFYIVVTVEVVVVAVAIAVVVNQSINQSFISYKIIHSIKISLQSIYSIYNGKIVN